MTHGQRDERDTRRRPLIRIIVVLSFLAALWFVLGDEERRSAVGSIGFRGFAVLLGISSVGSLLIAGSWSAVVGQHVGGRDALVEYLIYQPAKYLPGGIAQGLLQMSHVQGVLGSWVRSSGVFVAHLAVLTAAGLVVSFPAIMSRFGGVVGVLAVAIVAFGGLVFLRLSDRFAVSFETLPSLPRLAAALSMAACGLGLWGVGYGLTISELAGTAFSPAEVARFGAGWLAGFLALPIPAGIGVREGVLAAFSNLGVSVVVTASILLRLAVAVAESVIAFAALALSRRSN